MNSFIEQIEIENFKSIRHLKMDGFRRINLFIGKPNVGKSNILEALSVFTVPNLQYNYQRKLSDIIRIENLNSFFHDLESQKLSKIRLDQGSEVFCCNIEYSRLGDSERLNFSNQRIKKYGPSSEHIEYSKYFITSDLMYFNIDMTYPITHVKRYIFQPQKSEYDYTSSPFLSPPFGANLMSTLERLPELRKIIAGWFEQYGLKLVLDRATNSLRIQKEIGENEVYTLPYSLLADTLQRIIFYKTAIASNNHSVLVFEEPEAHAYPPYIAEFTQDVINSTSNQFFMATHSPIIVNDFLENAIDDLAIFMVDFKDGQTVVKGLSREEIEDVYKYGIDLFFNGESYQV